MGCEHDHDEDHGHDHDHSGGVNRTTLLLTAASGLLLAAGFACGHLLHREDVEPVLFILAILAAGAPLAPEAVKAALRLRPDMNLLMVIAVIGAAAIGEWHEGATVIFLFSVAEALEQFSLDRARNAIRKLLDLAPTEATVKRTSAAGERVEERVPVEAVQVGHTLVVKPGEKIPLDGEVASGASAVNQAPITGESLPVAKTVGDTVFAGSLNEHGALEVRVTRLAQDTTLARIIHLVEEAQEQRAPSQRFVDKFARYYTPNVLFAAVALMVIPPLAFHQPFGEWFYRALVLLVIACPCALVISTPVAIVSGLASAARQGVLIKGGVHLEQAGRLKAIAFDKTGTLTKGVPEVSDVIPLNDHTPADVLRVAAALESRSEHPLAQAVLRRAAAQGVAPGVVGDFEAFPGKGARGNVEGRPDGSLA
ncbi:MAG: cadmium-translocating P-type ATPase [Armatimonadetes bacterium CG_4_10_14_3_um_filter_66_18]|nr:cadmium-translocating P-type ATPase [Armatimonadota bacterium]OIP00082.1 MAG: cadmium-translocating P-type ATPase [Armatimonadetes bacterium CG2_30_66_41]PIU94754.1 MAG: cadmium-translocating P-type ATPase [Armatimonadetes bacterium CG06_land_8_20_14_3_00_66_21]PIX41849.1 MAG: cadmium-translocating P-type ATPase [Armatimonadetes bacterium CG_4_8_14_3_um_filter_66_20]PIY51069.1 MAG: cadmium-translocating P-type ATPase [Armatimonadetes bacterium CG_4_10_14_3_um_filter_66_18]PIZ39150.1 MAG: ca